MFTAVLGLDSKRIASNRLDLICCVRLPQNEDNYEDNHESILLLFMKNCYAPFILNKYIRMIVVSEGRNVYLDVLLVHYSLVC